MSIHNSPLGKDLMRITGKRSAEQVAKSIGMSPAQLSRIFSGKSGISSTNIEKFLKLGVSLESIPEPPIKQNKFYGDIRFSMDLLEIICIHSKDMEISTLSLKDLCTIKASCDRLGFYNYNLVKEMLRGMV